MILLAILIGVVVAMGIALVTMEAVKQAVIKEFVNQIEKYTKEAEEKEFDKMVKGTD